MVGSSRITWRLQMNEYEKKFIGLSALGGMLELYDLAIYGTYLIYCGHKFFPSDNLYTVIMQTYMVCLISFILSPICRLLFRHIDDEHGRKKILIAIIFIMGVSSSGIVCLPGYYHVGLVAPILLLLCRLLQSLAICGKLPTTYVYISESLSKKRLIAYGITMTGIFSGYLLVSLVNYILLNSFNTPQLHTFGWRIPFVLGGIIWFISYKIRRSLHETEDFKNILDKPNIPIMCLLKYYWAQVLIGIVLEASTKLVLHCLTRIFIG